MSLTLPINGGSVDSFARPGQASIEPARSALELLILPVTDGRLVAPSCARRARLCVEWTRLMRPTRCAPPSLRGRFAPGVDRSLPSSAPLYERTIRLHSPLRKLVYGIEHLCCLCDL